MTYSAYNGYADAVLINDILNRVLQTHNASDVDNQLGYHALIRTIHTSLNIIRPQVGLKKALTHIETVVPE